jgi:hypothetical protein
MSWRKSAVILWFGCMRLISPAPTFMATRWIKATFARKETRLKILWNLSGSHLRKRSPQLSRKYPELFLT